jgi:hypothetical protein
MYLNGVLRDEDFIYTLFKKGGGNNFKHQAPVIMVASTGAFFIFIHTTN